MFRVPGKEGSPSEKGEDKKKEKQQVKQQFLLFAGVVLLLKIGKEINSFLLLRNILYIIFCLQPIFSVYTEERRAEMLQNFN